jgi:hypothetical protein
MLKRFQVLVALGNRIHYVPVGYMILVLLLR